jgi:hemerythrin
MKLNCDVLIRDDRLVLGIPVIDKQHRNLLRITSKLNMACQDMGKTADRLLNETVHDVIECMGSHFRTEEKIMVLLQYQEYGNHKKIHEDFIKQILKETALFPGTNGHSSKHFIHSLNDQVLSHIAIHDQMLSDYIRNMKEYGKFGMLFINDTDDVQTGV